MASILEFDEGHNHYSPEPIYQFRISITMASTDRQQPNLSILPVRLVPLVYLYHTVGCKLNLHVGLMSV